MPGRFLLLSLALLLVVTLGVGLWLYLRTPAPALVERTPPATTADWYSVYFTTPPQRVAAGGGAGVRHGSLDEQLVTLIGEATKSVDVAIYDFDLENVAEALASAKNRGVAVRMVTDSDTLGNKDEAIQKSLAIVRKADIPIVADGRAAIMHHKFVVVDREWVWTGSWNFTEGDTFRLNNNAARIRSPQLAENFTVEFDKMFAQKKFGPTKPKDLPHPVVEHEGARIQTCFESEMQCDALIVDVLRSARERIHFMAFSFTHDDIAQAMIQRHQGGVRVVGVFEKTGSETEHSELARLRKAGAEVYQDGNRYAMHHKVIIVDGTTVVFGSFNFSASAAKDNDENLLVITHAPFAAEFEQEFQRVLAEAKEADRSRR